MSENTCTPKAGRQKFIKISSPIMIFHTRHSHSVADRLRSKSLVRVEYQLQGFHGNKTACCSLRSAFGGDVALFISYKWRHSDVIIINLTGFIQNEIPYKTYILDLFCIWKITEFMPTCLMGSSFWDIVYNTNKTKATFSRLLRHQGVETEWDYSGRMGGIESKEIHEAWIRKGKKKRY